MKLATSFVFALSLLALSSPAFADDEENSGDKVQGAINKRIDKSMELSEYCAEHPEEAKCVARKKAKRAAKREKMQDHIQMYKDAMKDPELKAVIEKEESKSNKFRDDTTKAAMKNHNDRQARKDMISDIDKYCRVPASESCKIAKKDYEEWKAKNP